MVDTVSDVTEILQRFQEIAEGHKTPLGTLVPASARPVFAQGFAVAPAVGAANQVIIPLSSLVGPLLGGYQVPRGMQTLICGIVLGYVGGGGGALPGQVLYTIDVDNPFAVPTPGLGYTEKDYALVPFQLGSFVPGDPWPVEFRHTELETIRIKAQTVGGIPVGPGNFVYGALFGFQGPSKDWPR